MLEKYDIYLGSKFSDNYWSDEGICRAVSLLEKFSLSDWYLLKQICLTKPINWAIRCAETLGDNVNEQSFDLLLILLNYDSQEVKFAALDSINAFASAGFDVKPYSNILLKSLASVKEKAGHVEKFVLDALARRLE